MELSETEVCSKHFPNALLQRVPPLQRLQRVLVAELVHLPPRVRITIRFLQAVDELVVLSPLIFEAHVEHPVAVVLDITFAPISLLLLHRHRLPCLRCLRMSTVHRAFSTRGSQLEIDV